MAGTVSSLVASVRIRQHVIILMVCVHMGVQMTTMESFVCYVSIFSTIFVSSYCIVLNFKDTVTDTWTCYFLTWVLK